jgi:hypothetical protein
MLDEHGAFAERGRSGDEAVDVFDNPDRELAT